MKIQQAELKKIQENVGKQKLVLPQDARPPNIRHKASEVKVGRISFNIYLFHSLHVQPDLSQQGVLQILNLLCDITFLMLALRAISQL